MKPGMTRGWRRTVGENAVCKAGGEFERSCAERIASPRAIRVPRISLSLFHPLLSPFLTLSCTYTSYIHSYPLRVEMRRSNTHAHTHASLATRGVRDKEGNTRTHSRIPLPLPSSRFLLRDSRERNTRARGGGGGDRVSSRESAVVDGNPRPVGSHPRVTVSRRDAVQDVAVDGVDVVRRRRRRRRDARTTRFPPGIE